MLDIHKFSFFSATIRLWNNSSDSILNLDSPEAFRKSTTDFWTNNYYFYT